MPKALNLLFASEASAAKMMDMKPVEFRALVDNGALPPPVRIGDFERWEVDALAQIQRGDPARPEEGFDL